jgi:hypothetical protein
MKKKKQTEPDYFSGEPERRFPGSATPAGGFRVPDGYFEQLPGRIRERIGSKNHVALHNRRRLYTVLAVAAGVLALVATLVTLYFIPAVSIRPAALNRTDTTSDFYEEYILGKVDESVLMELMLSGMISGDSLTVSDSTFLIRLNGFEVPPEDVIEFLVSEEISNDMIAEASSINL